MVLIKSALLVAAVAAETPAKGTEQKCFGPRMHKIDYDVANVDKDGNPEDFSVKITAQPEESDKCPQTNGGLTKAICVGVNTDDCTAAAESIPINDFVSCENCFLGITSDIFLDMEVKGLKLKDVSLGIKNAHLAGAVEVQVHAEKGQTLAEGTVPIITRKLAAHIDFLAGGVVPVDIAFTLPTELSYAVSLGAEATAKIGGDLDIDLGDHFLSWNKEDGWTQQHSEVNMDSITWTPVLEAHAEAKIKAPLGLKSIFEIKVNKLLRYGMNIEPKMPIQAGWESEEADQICVSGDASLDVSHDADLHFEWHGYEKTFASLMHQDIWSNEWPDVFKKCITIPSPVVV